MASRLQPAAPSIISDDAQPYAVFVATATLIACLALQRVALPIGEFKLSIATPILVALVAAGLATGRMTIVRQRLLWFLGFAAWALITTAIASELLRRAGLRGSLPSLAHLLLLCAGFVMRFARPHPAGLVAQQVQRGLLVVALAGIAQFAAQFAGVALFSFDGFLPSAFSIEPLYNGVIAIGATGLSKSNGFTLVEPSVYAQLMALALAIEMSRGRRLIPLAIFAVGLIASVSGTGWLMLGVLVGMVAISPAQTRPRLILPLLLVVGVCAVLAFAVLDDIGQALLVRWTEFGEERSSGHLRFVAPFLALERIAELHPGFILTGLGPGAGEDVDLGFSYSVHAPGKILIEFGLPGLLLWLGLVVASCRRRGNALVLVPALAMFFFGGGYQQFAPIIGLMLILFAWPADADALAPVHD